MTNQARSLISMVVIGLSFSLIAAYLIYQTFGLKYNPASGRLVSTGILLVNSIPTSNLKIELSGQEIGQTTPLRLSKLVPGRYELSISALDRQKWSSQIAIEPGLVLELPSPLLPLDRPIKLESSLEDQRLIVNTSLDPRLSVSSNELRLNGQLVTRLLEPIEFAALHPTGHQLIFQSGSKIYLIDQDGSNTRQILDLESNQPAVFRLLKDGSELLYQQGETLEKIKWY